MIIKYIGANIKKKMHMNLTIPQNTWINLMLEMSLKLNIAQIVKNKIIQKLNSFKYS